MEESKNKAVKNRIIKGVAVASIMLFMLPGIYLAGMRYVGNHSISLAATVGTAVVFVVLLVVGVLLGKRGKLAGFLKAVLVVTVVLLLLANAALLVSPYFVPHQTTHMLNRFYPGSLYYTSILERYVLDKTVFVAQDNTYLQGEGDAFTAIDHSNKTAVWLAAGGIDYLSKDQSEMTKAQQAAFLSLQGNYKAMTFVHDRKESAYFYTGITTADYDNVVFLLNSTGDAFWMPMAIYEQVLQQVTDDE